MTSRYDVLISLDEESGLFLAEVPDLPGCFSQGDTPDQAEANVSEAIKLHIETLLDLGRDIPSPSAHMLRAVEVAVA